MIEALLFVVRFVVAFFVVLGVGILAGAFLAWLLGFDDDDTPPFAT